MESDFPFNSGFAWVLAVLLLIASVLLTVAFDSHMKSKKEDPRLIPPNNSGVMVPRQRSSTITLTRSVSISAALDKLTVGSPKIPVHVTREGVKIVYPPACTCRTNPDTCKRDTKETIRDHECICCTTTGVWVTFVKKPANSACRAEIHFVTREMQELHSAVKMSPQGRALLGHRDVRSKMIKK